MRSRASTCLSSLGTNKTTFSEVVDTLKESQQGPTNTYYHANRSRDIDPKRAKQESDSLARAQAYAPSLEQIPARCANTQRQYPRPEAPRSFQHSYPPYLIGEGPQFHFASPHKREMELQEISRVNFPFLGGGELLVRVQVGCSASLCCPSIKKRATHKQIRSLEVEFLLLRGCGCLKRETKGQPPMASL